MMTEATKEILRRLDAEAEERKKKIREAADGIDVSGTVYYAAADGDDKNDGRDPAHPWKTLRRVSAACLRPGDAVKFRRGDLFRGQIICREGVAYAAYGQGEKPRIYGWERDLADPDLWEAEDEARGIYRLKEPMPDCGTLVFNGGECCSRKLIPSFCGGRFVCREDPDREFSVANEMTRDLDLFCACVSVMTEEMSHGETWPVPKMCAENRGTLYLRCDRGNPGAVFRSIEALPGRHTMVVGENANVRIDNLCLRYCGAHAISAGGYCVKGLRVTNCEIGWVGGTVQHYLGTDPNYPEGTRGSVTRYGNGIEIYGGCEDYLCAGNYVYQVYDAGMTHQYTVPAGETCVMKNVRYTGNLVENCVYSIEYFLSQTHGTQSRMDGLTIDGNMLRFSGYGWGQQRHNTWTPAHIKSWTFENPARDYRVTGNIFDRAAYRLLHLCCEEAGSYPVVDGNTYVQTYGRPLGQFGAYEKETPQTLAFLEAADADISGRTGDRNAAVYYLKSE